MSKKQINKKATIQNIIDWGNRSIGHSINMSRFNEEMEKPSWEKMLKKIARFCNVEIVYN